MKEYLERQIEKESKKVMRNYSRALSTYLIAISIIGVALLISLIIGSVEWKKAVVEFMAEDWIFHSRFTLNNILILLGVIMGLTILTIPFYRRLREIKKLEKQRGLK